MEQSRGGPPARRSCASSRLVCRRTNRRPGRGGSRLWWLSRSPDLDNERDEQDGRDGNNGPDRDEADRCECLHDENLGFTIRFDACAPSSDCERIPPQTTLIQRGLSCRPRDCQAGVGPGPSTHGKVLRHERTVARGSRARVVRASGRSRGRRARSDPPIPEVAPCRVRRRPRPHHRSGQRSPQGPSRTLPMDVGFVDRSKRAVQTPRS
jgi:hypothetical protein